MRKNIITAIAFLIIIAFNLTPPFHDVSKEGMSLIGIGIASLLLWNFVELEWPSFLCISGIVLFSGVPASEIFSMALGSWIVIFLLACFMISHSLNEEGFTKRLATIFITNKHAQRNPWYFILFFLTGALTMSSIMSPTATFLVFCPIAEKVFTETACKKGEYLPSLLIVSLAIAVNIGSAMTPLGHAIPMLAISFCKIITGVEISFPAYSLFGVLIGLVIYASFIIILKKFFIPDLTRFKSFNAVSLRADLPPPSKRECMVTFIFFMIILMWLLPEAVAVLHKGLAEKLKSGGAAIPPMLGVVALCLINVDGRPLLNAKEALKKTVPWSTLLLLSAVLSLGSVIIKPQFGVMNLITNSMSQVVSGTQSIMFLMIFVSWAVIQSNFTPNSLSVTLVSSVAMPFMTLGNNTLSTAAVAAVIGVAASMSLSTAPVSSPNSVAATSGWWQGDIALKLGSIVSILSVPIIIFLGYPIARLVIK